MKREPDGRSLSSHLIPAPPSVPFVCLVLRSERDVRKEPEDTEVNDERTERRAERQTDETSVTDAGSLRSFRSLTSYLGLTASIDLLLVCFHVRPLFSSLFIYARAAGSDECNEERANA